MRLLLAFFISAALWDAFTTFYGTLSIFYSSYDMGFAEMLTNDPRKTGAAVGFAIVIMLLLFSAKFVLEKGLHIMFRILIGITFLYDVVTSYIGNQAFIIQSQNTSVTQFFVLIGLTVVISSASIAIPYLKPQSD